MNGLHKTSRWDCHAHLFGPYEQFPLSAVARVTDWRHPVRVRGVVVLGAAARQFPPGMNEALAIASDPARLDSERLAGHLVRLVDALGTQGMWRK